VTPAEALDAVVAALEAAGLAVASRAADLAPPCAYVRLYRAADGGAVLEVDRATTLAVHWVPVRGLDDAHADAAGVEACLGAVSPITADVVTFQDTTVTIGDVAWPCYRAEAVCY
jgi:hypothetical protein